MADLICRSLRDGVLEGEHAPSLIIKDSLNIPLGSHVFNHLLCSLGSNVSSGRSQSKGLVLVTFTQNPCFYLDLLKRRGIDEGSLDKWFRILDCYSDPLGWKDQLRSSELCSHICSESQAAPKVTITLFKDVRDADKLVSSILELGRGITGQGKGHFSVAIDLVSALMRHASLQSVSRLINDLRSHAQVSSMFWLIHSDLHELKEVSSLEYISSMVATLGPMIQSTDAPSSNSENQFWLEQNYRRGKLHVRLKRRNGRVKVLCEEFHLEQGGIKFVPVPSMNVVAQNLLPKVQFNLRVSEKESIDRAMVVLPFEHQGNGKNLEIYDGRRSLGDQNDPTLNRPVYTTPTVDSVIKVAKGEIHYFRDSDDEPLDSDEDPDDDLDI